LVLAATVFYKTGRTDVAEIKVAHELLQPMLGSKLAPILFAVALIASGQSSTITGTLAGQIVMEGYLQLRISPWVRRLMTRLIAIIPAVIVILINGEDNIDSLLVLSQVILSLQLGFAIIPLIHFTSNKKTMGHFAIKPLVIIISSLVALILVYLNIRMVIEQATTFFATPDNLIWKIIIVLAGLGFMILLVVAVVYPLLGKKQMPGILQIHTEAGDLKPVPVPSFNKIALALDFSEHDSKLIAYALGQGSKNTNYILIHVVESAPARILGSESDDLESRKDEERMENYVQQLIASGYNAVGLLGYKSRAKEIIRIVKDQEADMLVIGAHRHTGIKDLIYGETVNTVRHELNIPVLIVNL
jgi:manganese transport protein